MGLYFTSKLLELEEKVSKITLSSDAQKQYQTGKISDRLLDPFVRQIKLLSDKYISTGKQVLMNKEQIEAYALYYLPINFAKICSLISNIQSEQTSLSDGNKLKILDFGCGPGSGLAACLYSNLQIESMTAFDSSKDCLAFCEKLVKQINPCIKYTGFCEFEQLKLQSFDLIIAANVLTESNHTQRIKIINDLISLLGENGTLLIIEPAQLQTTRKLMSERDQIIKDNLRLSIIFPCTTKKDCPMLRDRQQDWCHGTLAASFWQSSNLIKQFDHLLKFNKHRLKYSALVIKKSSEDLTRYARIIATSGRAKTAEICCSDGLVQIRPDKIKDIETRRALKANDNYRRVDISKVRS